MLEDFLMVQWLGLHAFTAKGLGSIPGWGTKAPQAVQCGKKKKKKNRRKRIRYLIYREVGSPYSN